VSLFSSGEYVVQILKRNGSVEPFDADKVNAMAVWAIAGNEKLVSWSDIVMLAMKQLPKDNVVPSSMVQDALIKASLEMQTPAYNRVAGRLLLGVIRKTVDVPRSFKQYYQYAVERNLWRKMNYTEQQLDVLEKHINHDKDLEYGYPTLRQFVDKFGRKDADGKLQELPQFMFMGIAMSLFENESLDDVILYYKKASEQKINIPSPIMTGQRTESNVGVSCVIATAGDSLHGIESAKHIAFMATASSAGLGLEYDVRSPKEDVRNGYAKAGGKIPHYKALETITKETKQMSRGGSATVSFNVLDPEVMTLLSLKLPRSPEERRITQLDYSLLWNTSFLRKVAKNGDWPLVSIRQEPLLYEDFSTSDVDYYDKLIDIVLAKPNTLKVKARAIWDLWISNRTETGRIYRTNLTHANQHTPFNTHKIRLSNLC